jgi:hypothetical protein
MPSLKRHHPASKQRTSRARLALGWLLIAALLAVQSFTLLHRVAHPPGLGNHAAHLGHAAHDDHHDHSSHLDSREQGWLQALFSNHTEASDCRLLDALGASDGAPTSLPCALPMVLSAAQLTFYAGQALARWAALYQARGPPLSR